MLRTAAAGNIAAVVATPHCNVLPYWKNYNTEEFRGKFLELRAAAQAQQIPVQIIAGAEVRVTKDLPRLLREGGILTINGGKYMLAEFDERTVEGAFPGLLEPILETGVIPLIAHPERYAALWQDPSIVGTWLEMGCHIQITAGSVLGKFGGEPQKAARYLLRGGMVSCIASDAHGTRWRTNNLTDVYDHLCLHYDKSYARTLLWENPLRICGSELL